MPKKKDYRKVRPLKGTIFDNIRGHRQDAVTRQRRLGFWYSHGINPAAVANSAKSHPTVESIGNGRVRVYYDAVYLPADQKAWSESHQGRITIPVGIRCDHGGAKRSHTVTQIKSVVARLEEVI